MHAECELVLGILVMGCPPERSLKMSLGTALALSSLKSALSRSSAHFVGLTFIRQIVFFYVALNFVNQSCRVKQDDKRKAEVSILYYHVFSNNWKSLAQRCGLHKSFSTDFLYT